jgi:hypothetical protein
MEYTKPALQTLGQAETLVLGSHVHNGESGGANTTHSNSSFEFED